MGQRQKWSLRTGTCGDLFQCFRCSPNGDSVLVIVVDVAVNG